MDQFITAALIPALQLDSLSNSHPVSVEVKDPGEINVLFDTISYNKVGFHNNRTISLSLKFNMECCAGNFELLMPLGSCPITTVCLEKLSLICDFQSSNDIGQLV